MKTTGTAGITKRVLIEKANTTTVIAAGIAAFLVVFSAVAARSLVSQASYQNAVISAKKDTLKTIEDNLEARKNLTSSYEAFVAPSKNIIGGNAVGSSVQDGDNATIILDALPSKYDYPGLVSSLDKVVQSQGAVLEKVNGIDEEVAQAAQTSSGMPQPIPMPFDFAAKGAYQQVQGLTQQFEKSIRPIQVQKISILANDQGGVTATVTAQTFYQPAKKLELKKEVFKQ